MKAWALSRATRAEFQNGYGYRLNPNNFCIQIFVYCARSQVQGTYSNSKFENITDLLLQTLAPQIIYLQETNIKKVF